MNLVELFTEQAGLRPDAPAIVESRGGRPRVTSFAQLDQASRRGAALLKVHGVQPGDPVLIFQPMSAELYEALLAVFRLGATAMFLDPATGREHIEECCQIQPPRALVASTKAHLLRLRSSALRRIPLKFVVGWPAPGAISWGRIAEMIPHEALHPCGADTPALLTFTSGSTGQPKAAVRSHGFLLAQHRVLERSLELRAGEVDLTTLPIFLLANLASGVTSVIPNADLRRPGAIDPRPVLAQISEHGVSRCAASPAFFERLLAGRSARPKALAGLRSIYTGGAPVFPRLLDALGRALPRTEIHAVYGSTEAEPIAHLERCEISAADRAAMLAGRGLLTGRPVPEIQLRIMREQWGRSVGSIDAAEFAGNCLPPSEAGEIVVSGEHVLSGYLHGRGDAETKFRVAGVPWHRTGDAGWLDDQGRLWLLGRCSAKITDSRGTLWPFAVECAAQEQPAVRRAALVGQQGRRLLAIEPSATVSREDCEALKQALAWAALDEVRVVPRLPVDRRHNAKIDYPALHEMLRRATRVPHARVS